MRHRGLAALWRAFLAVSTLTGVAPSHDVAAAEPRVAGGEDGALRAIDSLVVGTTTEEAFLRAGWSFEASTQRRVGLLGVLWDDGLEGGHSVHSYFLGYCSGPTADAAANADAALRRARESTNRPPTWDLRFCPGPRSTPLRYVQFHDGKLFKIEGPPP